MDKLIQSFSNQIKKAVEINNKINISISKKIHSIIICGVGGSGIGGQIVKEITNDNLKVPFFCNNDYTIPKFVNENTLAIISSYSGNTEETLHAYKKCLESNAQIICITSGGELEKIAKEKKHNLILIPGGDPPRTCLAYSVVSLLITLYKLKLTETDYIKINHNASFFINSITNFAKEIAMEVAKECFQSLPILYTPEKYKSIGIRTKQQLNENSKMFTWCNVIPEMNHNELVGWASGNDNITVLFFEPDDMLDRNKKRFTLTKSIIRSKGAKIIEIKSKGKTKTERFFYYIHFGDWLSYFLAVKNNVDPFEIEVINHLKMKLSNN